MGKLGKIVLVMGGLVLFGALITDSDGPTPVHTAGTPALAQTNKGGISEEAIEAAIAVETERRRARMSGCDVLGGRDRAICRSEVQREIARAREDVERLAAEGRLQAQQQPAAETVQPAGCAIEAFTYSQMSSFVHITGSMTCREGRMTLRIYDGSGQFLTSDTAYIQGYAFSSMYSGTAPGQMNLKYTVD